jgi:hypothetical protein
MIPRIYHNLHNCKKKNSYKEFPATKSKVKNGKGALTYQDGRCRRLATMS